MPSADLFHSKLCLVQPPASFQLGNEYCAALISVWTNDDFGSSLWELWMTLGWGSGGLRDLKRFFCCKKRRGGPCEFYESRLGSTSSRVPETQDAYVVDMHRTEAGRQTEWPDILKGVSTTEQFYTKKQCSILAPKGIHRQNIQIETI